MRPRTAALLLLSIAGLFLAGAGLSVRLLRAGLHTASLATEQRLHAIGLTATQALVQGASPGLLDKVARANDLEAAYLLDASLRPWPNTGASGLAVSLLRLDPDRALQALAGQPSVGPAYRLEGLEGRDGPSGLSAREPAETTVLAGYFPVEAATNVPPRLLVLEAGPAFVKLPAQLRATAWAAAATAFGLAALCALLVMAALRAAGREQRLRVEAERGKAVRELATMVAHEVRNPLGTIRAGAELLREQQASQEVVEDILSEVARLSNLTTQFLQFSRDPPLVVEPLDLASLCDELCVRLRREHPDEAVLRIRREGDAVVKLLGDADGLRQVLLNLALNAVQAMQGFPGSHELILSAEQLSEGGAKVRVSDTGHGISPEVRKTLFVPFCTTKPSGTGLGLAISQRIVEKHGGSLTLLEPTREGRGACFEIRLPVAPPAALSGKLHGKLPAAEEVPKE